LIRYKDIGFRSVERSDLELIRKEHNEEPILLMLRDPGIVTETMQNKWFESISSNRNNTVFTIFYKKPDKAIGVWKLQGLDDVNRCTEIGLDIFSAYRHKGYGQKAFQMIFKYLFDSLNIHTVYAKVGEYNEISLKAAQKAGFRISGKMRETLYRKGRYWDNIVLDLTIDDYRQMSGNKKS
jgi:RimJ/RimL family protein N-acetyltransferase